MLNRARITLVAAAVLLAGCYHATVETGLPAGTTGVHQDWVSTWFFGLVPATPIDVSKQCPNGVAKVETQHSFLNMLVSGFTAIVWDPIQVDVTCASSNKMGALPADAAVMTVHAGATADEMKAAFQAAADRSAREGVPVYVLF